MFDKKQPDHSKKSGKLYPGRTQARGKVRGKCVIKINICLISAYASHCSTAVGISTQHSQAKENRKVSWPNYTTHLYFFLLFPFFNHFATYNFWRIISLFTVIWIISFPGKYCMWSFSLFFHWIFPLRLHAEKNEGK